MSRAHSQSTGLARHAGPYYCLGCGSDWPCDGHLREEADARRAAPRAEEPDVETVARVFEGDIGTRIYFFGAAYGHPVDESWEKIAADFAAEYARLTPEAKET